MDVKMMTAYNAVKKLIHELRKFDNDLLIVADPKFSLAFKRLDPTFDNHITLWFRHQTTNNLDVIEQSIINHIENGIKLEGLNGFIYDFKQVPEGFVIDKDILLSNLDLERYIIDELKNSEKLNLHLLKEASSKYLKLRNEVEANNEFIRRTICRVGEFYSEFNDWMSSGVLFFTGSIFLTSNRIFDSRSRFIKDVDLIYTDSSILGRLPKDFKLIEHNHYPDDDEKITTYEFEGVRFDFIKVDRIPENCLEMITDILNAKLYYLNKRWRYYPKAKMNRLLDDCKKLTEALKGKSIDWLLSNDLD